MHQFVTNFFNERIIDVRNNLPSTVNFATLTTFRRPIADVDLSKYIKSTSWPCFILHNAILSVHERFPVHCQVDLSAHLTKCFFPILLCFVLF